MPIRRELRRMYTCPRWALTRARILARAGGRFDLLGAYLGGAKCEECGAKDGGTYFNRRTHRRVTVQIGIAHRDHDDLERFYDDGNLRALCRKDHLRTDAHFHKQTRSSHKDSARPLLRGLSAEASA